MKPPSSDAKALLDEQPAQIRAAHRLFVAADEFGHLERRHQPIGQPAIQRRRVGRELRVRRRIHRSTCASAWNLPLSRTSNRVRRS